MKTNFYSLLKGKFLISDDSFKNWRIILFISGLAIVMIASSHSADKKVHEIAKLSNEVKELNSLFAERRARLMRLKMESTIERKMAEKGLLISDVPPKKIIVKSQEN